MKAEKIMFVCSGNICRSPLAHAVFQHLADAQGLDGRFVVESSGTDAYHVGENADSRMCMVAARNGISIHHRARRFAREDLQKYDRIYAMDRGHMRTIRDMASGKKELLTKIYLFRDYDPDAAGSSDVPDPWYGGIRDFERVFEIVMRTSRNLLSQLLEEKVPEN
jgi:protein-tyrosine phosphatase